MFTVYKSSQEFGILMMWMLQDVSFLEGNVVKKKNAKWKRRRKVSRQFGRLQKGKRG